ncbi:hypothetical protein EYC80_010121 [Monilinia laxa]|uniref:Uncharacterized protein n=1 Tax=Monilinia laxa TaxID=61186 RepID=A0A5N6JPM8_MONLA|nr:hypothetical protein EYC80_010121 [Monilinia laxa]
MGISKEKRERLRAAKGQKGKKMIKEERRATRAVHAPATNPRSFVRSPTPPAAAAPSQPDTTSSLPQAKAPQASFSARIADAAAQTPGRHRHKRASAPSQTERLSKRETFRELTGIPLANLGLGLSLEGSIAPDIVVNWLAEALGEELRDSDDEEEDEDMEDDDEDEGIEDQRYDSEVCDSYGNEWAALGVKMKM